MKYYNCHRCNEECDNYIMIIKFGDRQNLIVSGIYGTEFEAVEFNQTWKVIDDLDSDMTYCEECIIQYINEGKIILDPCSQNCYICQCGFKDYKSMINKLNISVSENGICIASDKDQTYIYSLQNIVSKESVESSIKLLVDSWPEDVIKYWKYGMDCISGQVLWICYPCLNSINFPPSLKLFLQSPITALMDEGTNKSVDEGTNKGTNKSMDEGTNKSVDEGTNKGIDEGINKGTNKSVDEGTNKSVNEGVDEGTNKIMNKIESKSMPPMSGCNLPTCLVTIIGEYVPPPYLVYNCKICNSENHDSRNDRPNVAIYWDENIIVGFTSINIASKLFPDGVFNTFHDYAQIFFKMKSNIKDGKMDDLIDNYGMSKDEICKLIKPEYSKGFICETCIKNLIKFDLLIFKFKYHWR